MKYFFIIISASLLACNPVTKPVIEDNSAEFASIVSSVSQNIILATYRDLKNETQKLEQNVRLLSLNPNAENLELAKDSWRKARMYWEQSEGFIFGPVETKGLDPKLDSWPVNKIDLDAVLNGNNSLNTAYIEALEGTLKGFHTLEYLMFGTIDNKKTVATITKRELEYLLTCTENLNKTATQLFNSWDYEGENFVSNFTKIGLGNSLYSSPKAAMQEIINGMITIADEVANGKIADPYKEQDRRLEESQFSDNSNQDFANNIQSIKNLYTGLYNSTQGEGISYFIAKKNSSLDARVRSELDEAISLINEMKPTFGEAIFNNKPSVEKSQTAVLKLKQTLEQDILNLVLGN